MRLQIVVALTALMGLSFGPLYFAVASLTAATVKEAREQAAIALGRVVASDVTGMTKGAPPTLLARVLAAHARQDRIAAICVFGADGARIACEGSPQEVTAMPGTVLPAVESTRPFGPERDPEIEIVSPGDGGSVVTHLHVDADPGAALIRLVALYMGFFALALLLFTYFALTRLIVQPVDQLVQAADRVAAGARTLRTPRGGARELSELGQSMDAMARRLIAEETALKRKVAELTDTTTRLTMTQAQLVRSERMASVGRMAAGIAHELGNPIAALIGLEDLLLEGDLSAESQTDFLRRMRSETQRIHAVIRDLLDFARPEEMSGQAGGDEPPAVVGEVVRDVIALTQPQRSFRNVKLDADVDAPLRVRLSGPRLTQVLLNLVLNAGAAVAARTGGHVVVRARPVEPSQVQIDVEDNGPGVAPEVRDRLFEPFVTTKAVGEGTGLGLAVCRGLVESAGGAIWVDAGYEHGARFVVTLPAALE